QQIEGLLRRRHPLEEGQGLSFIVEWRRRTTEGHSLGSGTKHVLVPIRGRPIDTVEVRAASLHFRVPLRGGGAPRLKLPSIRAVPHGTSAHGLPHAIQLELKIVSGLSPWHLSCRAILGEETDAQDSELTADDWTKVYIALGKLASSL